MAVGNPYGQGAYGSGPYARFAGSRPYGVGAYGAGAYGRWGGNTFDVAGHASITFVPTAKAGLQYQFGAETSIAWNVVALSLSIEIHPWAITEITFGVWAHLTWNWVAPRPCEAGTWQSALPCEPGTWTTPAPCSPGAWTVTRLETV